MILNLGPAPLLELHAISKTNCGRKFKFGTQLDVAKFYGTV